MADETNPPSPSGPGEGHRDHGYHPSSRHEGGRHSSRHEQSRRQIVEGPIPDTDSIRDQSVSSGAVVGGAAATMDEEEEECFSSREREPSAQASSSSDEEHKRRRHGHRRSRRGHRRRSLSAVGKGASGEALPRQSLFSPPQQSLVSDSNIVMLNELLERSLREEGLTSSIADLLSTLTSRVKITPPGSSIPSAGSAVPWVPSMSGNTRMAMADFGTVSKFSGS